MLFIQEQPFSKVCSMNDHVSVLSSKHQAHCQLINSRLLRQIQTRGTCTKLQLRVCPGVCNNIRGVQRHLLAFVFVRQRVQLGWRYTYVIMLLIKLIQGLVVLWFVFKPQCSNELFDQGHRESKYRNLVQLLRSHFKTRFTRALHSVPGKRQNKCCSLDSQ